MFKKALFISLTLLLSAAVATAQTDTCPPLIETALEQVGDSCGTLERNSVCYGSISLEAEAQPTVSDFTFAAVGDTVNLLDLRSLQTSPLNEEAQTWGVAVLSVQANLPDTLPGQNVTMIVYGDSTLEPQLAPTLPVTSSGTINVRQQPNTSAAIVGKLSSASPLNADGRLEDNTWVRVRLTDETVGWVSLDVAAVDGDLNTLPVRLPDDIAVAAQSAFYFTSGIGQSACAELPSGGLMVQSPQGSAVELVINDVNIEIGSTVAIRFLDKVPGATEADPELPHLAFYVLEGSIQQVALVGGTQARPASLPTVKEGLVLYVPVIAETGLPSGQDPLIKPYDAEDIDSLLPLVAALPAPITPAAPMSEAAFIELQTIVPQAGAWVFSPTTAPATCLDTGVVQDIGPLLPVVANALSGTLSADEADANTFVLAAAGVPVPLTLTRDGVDVFSGTSDYGTLTLKLASPRTGVLRLVTPLTSGTGEQLCAETEIFLAAILSE